MKETVLDCDFFILNRLPELYSAQRFQAEINRLHLNAKLISPEVLIDQAPQIEARGLRPAVLYRQGEFNFWPTQRRLSELPFLIINPPSAFLKARDKWTTAQIWNAHNIPTPRTLLASAILAKTSNLPMNLSIDRLAKEIFIMLTSELGKPFILKKRFSSQGQGVFLIDDDSSLEKILSEDLANLQTMHDLERTYFKNEYAHLKSGEPPSNWLQLSRWLAQECILESLGHDVRVFSIKHQAYAIERKNSSSFRSNLHQGGIASTTRLSVAEHELVERVHLLSELSYSGIDFLRTARGPLVLEINPSAGYEGIEKIYPAANVAGSLLQLLVR